MGLEHVFNVLKYEAVDFEIRFQACWCYGAWKPSEREYGDSGI